MDVEIEGSEIIQGVDDTGEEQFPDQHGDQQPYFIDETVDEEARDEQSQRIKTQEIFYYKANFMQDDDKKIPDEMILKASLETMKLYEVKHEPRVRFLNSIFYTARRDSKQNWLTDLDLVNTNGDGADMT